MILDFNITPYVNVGPIFFGAKRSDLHKILGAPNSTRHSSFGNNVLDSWTHESIIVTSSGDSGTVLEVSFRSAQRTASVRKISLFDRPQEDVYRELCRLDGAPRIRAGVTVLFKFGIAMAGFSEPREDDQDDRSVTAFARDVWDEHDPKFKFVKV